MPRYFIEVAYVGTRYGGFQVQLNSNTIQAEVTRALQIYFSKEFALTGSSRTDAGVHALQNFFHFDTDDDIQQQVIYNLNAILPYDIMVKNIFKTMADAHCRFDAIARTYHYHIVRFKDPFAFERAYYYPFKINTDLLHEMAQTILQFNDFTSFSKKKTQVKSFVCNIQSSYWVFENNAWRYEIKANRFLRGMVKGLMGTMLRLAKNNQGSEELTKIFEKKNHAAADFSVPSDGLFLMRVEFKDFL
ncbi:MAG TPA: tRNA pseudouridine(38-40) synthase TruA [Parafilimonas sp.]|nr:tRNA pseudouridine(38-40) synthase TruA [Parafilimonas sp.]